jgi:predicted transcriptional regulator
VDTSARDCGPEEAVVVVLGALGWGAGQLRRLLQSVLDQEVQVITLIKDLAANVWIKRHQPASFAILLRHELLIQRRDFDVKVEGWEVEVG